MSANLLIQVGIPQQKLYDGVPFPAVLSPNSNEDKSQLLQTIKQQKSWIESLLRQSGAILFRGFDVNSPSDFNDLVEAFDYEEIPYIGGAAPRTSVVGRVYTANDSPPDRKIPFHHEMVQVPVHPSKLFFFCDVEPGSGGETPVVLSHVVYEKMKDKYPEFVEQLEEHGLIYIRVLGEDDDPSSAIGRGWKSTFFTNDKNVAEERATKLGMKLEWIEDGVKAVMGPVPAIKFNQKRQQKIWFNSMAAVYTAWKDARNDPVKAVTFGDGRSLPAAVLHDCLSILEDESVAIPWKKGDVMLIDNFSVLHARKSFTPPRRVLASLCK